MEGTVAGTVLYRDLSGTVRTLARLTVLRLYLTVLISVQKYAIGGIA